MGCSLMGMIVLFWHLFQKLDLVALSGFSAAFEVAPGMEVSYIAAWRKEKRFGPSEAFSALRLRGFRRLGRSEVRFTPDQQVEDYSYDLVVITEQLGRLLASKSVVEEPFQKRPRLG